MANYQDHEPFVFRSFNTLVYVIAVLIAIMGYPVGAIGFILPSVIAKYV